MAKKLLVLVLGPWTLTPDYGNTAIDSSRPHVVAPSAFISQRVTAGQISVKNDLKETATDAEFKKFWDESKDETGKVNEKLAVDSFLSKFGIDAPDETEEERTAREAKEKADREKAAKDAEDQAKKAKEEADKAQKSAANAGAAAQTATNVKK